MRRTGAAAVPDVARLLFPEDRALGAETHWYELRAVACGDLVPQTEEGIETVVWCTPAEAMAHAAGSFPTVRAVLERLEACLSDDKKR